MEPILEQRILPAIWRTRFRRTALALAAVWSVAAVSAFLLYAANQNQQIDVSGWPLWILGTTLVVTCLVVLLAWAWPVGRQSMIRAIEQKYPDLDASLMTAAEQVAPQGNRLSFLQMDVLRRVVAHSYQHEWAQIVPRWQLWTAPMAGLIGLLAFFAAMIALFFYTQLPPSDSVINFGDAVVDPSRYIISVEPGNIDVERGSSVLVLARFPDSAPTEATLVYEDAAGNQVRLPMSQSLEDPLFGGRIENVDQATRYRVEYADTASEEFRVGVFDYPELVRADAALSYPEYTGLESQTIQDVRRISAVQGTELKLEIHVNKPVREAALVPIVAEGAATDGEPLQVVPLISDPVDPLAYSAEWDLVEDQRFTLRLIDQDERVNRVPPRFVIRVLPNRPPQLKVIRPGRDIEASPLEEVLLTAEAWDDFRIESMGLQINVARKQDQQLELETVEVKPKRVRGEHLMALESLEVVPDDLVTYHFWAEDTGPDGSPRRVFSDLYFAEIRPLEEIFREGDPPPSQAQSQSQSQSQSGQNAQQAEQLAELQKQVITATWNLQRREQDLEVPTNELIADANTISEGQTAAIDQLQEAAQQIRDPQSQSVVAEIQSAMTDSVERLNAVAEQTDPQPLDEALEAQQRAYAGLLKLRARESEVSQQQQPPNSQTGQGGNQNSRSQDQLNQLELDNDRNRYEQEKTAESNNQDPAADEERQVLNRLKELARRQEDLNDRIKELVTELEEAQTEAEKQELERRLKSLREQQEKMLRDADELLERMNEAQNQQSMSEQAQQLSETRENLRRASESLQNREVAQAAADGTRAQQELESLRDEFKERAADQFSDQMREMRNQAQEIEQRQQEISQELDRELGNQPVSTQPAPNERRRLDDQVDEELDLEEALQQQQRDVEQLRESMRETIEQAETVEPLLAESLYDTYRESELNRPGQALENTRRSLQRGWSDDAVQQQQQAREGIENLRQGIEDAAREVLGDPTRALRQAEETLQRLNEGLESEIDEATDPAESGDANQPGAPGEQSTPAESSENGPPGSGENNPSDPDATAQPAGPPGDQPQDGQGKPGEGQSPSAASDGESSESAPDSNGDAEPQPPSESSNPPTNNPSESPSNPGGSPSPSSGNPSAGGGQNAADNPGQEPDGEQPPSSDNAAPNRNPEELLQRLGAAPTNNSDSPQNAGNSRTVNAGNQRMLRPIQGDDFREFYDELSDIEQMLDDPDLRAQASRIRQQARELRKEYKERHSAEPNWELVKLKVLNPLRELQRQVGDEIIRRTSPEALVPINREPVPAEYEDAVKRYYQRLGVGK